MLTAIIADDNVAERMHLGKLLQEIGDIEILGEAENGLDVLNLVSKLRTDVVFLDIEMPGLNGIDAAKELLALFPQIFIVFFTAHCDFAVEAFAIDSTDYLLKPFDGFRVRKTIARIQEKRVTREILNEDKNSKLAITSRGEIILLPVEQIIFIEKDGKNTTIIHTAKKIFKTTKTLNKLEAQLLEYKQFQRVHRSYIINLNMVERITPFADSSFIVKFTGYKKDAIISRSNIHAVKKRLNIG